MRAFGRVEWRTRRRINAADACRVDGFGAPAPCPSPRGPGRLSCSVKPLPSKLARDFGSRGARAMAMKRKASSTRKPPEPLDSHAEIDDWMRRVMPDLNPIVTRLDELIRQTHSNLQFAVKWKKAYYGLPDVGWMMEMVAYDVSVNVVF